MKHCIFFFLIFLCQVTVGQETYYKFQDEIYSEVRFREKLKTIETLYGEQGNYKYTTANYKVRSTQVRQDSIIQNVEVVLSQSNTAPLDINTGVQRFINNPLPDFKLQNLESHLKTNTDYTGKVTLINLWFTSCPPCITEIPYLNYLKDTYQEQVNFVAITFDTKDKVDRFLTRKPFHFEHLVDATTYLHKDLNNNAFPKLILIDKKGNVRFVENGVILSGNTASQPEAAVTGLKEQLDFLLKES
ncbi:TlpA disulfide reductase family protein [uncultured Dokdonia sp.]|uniref:TlpA family protein disulfide reductase n=1 Tax=uncultured Dokdonia sp. TaxID=575653 RepID=UPI002604622E|nr:TlpA disulfide reductase family protein [uncultured Dokdonia sp.]